MTEIDRRPPTLAIVVSTLVALSAAVALTAAAVEAAPIGFLGVVFVVAGVTLVSRRLLTYGAILQALGIAFAGFVGGGVEALVVAAVATGIAWDVGDHGLSLGVYVGRDARSRRNLLVHAAGSTLVGCLVAGIGYGTFLSAAGGQPIAALVFLLTGAIVLASAFR